ncbi:type I restriction endonuclease subunit R [methane-oxidizing endosymbiont of Gigantopelta aegis]|uniref:type I restriction endonuclease subunit R n=1 Tax=methane-oxidizing endosymbiont of Gigantopelta aegis TaxID=2794938 RepID=UPI0018DBBAA9|nr:HsdR family type I site-specific deoxyribonuclease [methane-oxidizing endosymbiont of Gigantopelta aegis]
MSEYQFVERPLLTQLESMGWMVIDQGAGIPDDPTKSLRSDFRQWLLKDVFIKSVRKINKTDKNESWLTDSQLEQLYEDFIDFGTQKLLQANEECLSRLFKWQVDENTLTGEQDPVVKIIDFEHWEANAFIAINQFRIDTPGGVKEFIIPDIVLFVNGLPLVVIECKEANGYASDPMHEAIEQLRRYADVREETIAAGLKEGEQRLFWTNQLMVATHDEDARYGTITAGEDYFFQWKSIYPDETPYVDAVIGRHRPQENLVQGMLHPQKLLDMMRSFTLFMDAGDKRIKVVCRYQQYRAVHKIIERIRAGETSLERSGVVWHTQGSGKSLTMVFLVRKMRRDAELKDYKIVVVNDRRDLEQQLTETVALTGEKPVVIKSSGDLKEKLARDSSNLNMVMLHKFREADDSYVPDYVRIAMQQQAANESDSQYPKVAEPVLFESFGVVNPSEKVLVLIDEAHRTQRSGTERASLSDNLFDAFPNATRIAFTGTPLIAKHHSDPTWKRFGVDASSAYIDKYRLQDAVDDGATLQILYEGKTAEVAIQGRSGFDRKFEDLFRDRSEEELLAIRKKYGAAGDVLEAEERIKEIADDLVRHYAANILPSGFKAQVVCSSKQAAIHYQTSIRSALQKLIEEEQSKEDRLRDDALLKQLQFIDAVVVISSEGTNEKAVFVKARKEARELNAVKSFKKAFDFDDPKTGVAFLIVCDMLLTGFDAPIEQVMYLDKKLKEHNLLQAIARVNRTYPGKTRGYIVDYIGLANHLQAALSLYSGEDQQEILDGLKNVESEMPILESRYRRLIQLFEENKVSDIESFVKQKDLDDSQRYQALESAVEILEDIKNRDSFSVYLKKFMESMDIVLPNAMAQPYKIPMYQFAHIQAKAKERYKDGSISFTGVGEKVRKLINEHLVSLGIDPRIPPTELFSSQFITQVKKEKSPRAQASEMEHAIRKHCKVNWERDPVQFKRFSEKLEAVLKKYHDDWEHMVLALEVLRDEIQSGERQGSDPFTDLICSIAFDGDDSAETIAKVQQVTANIMDVLAGSLGGLNFWERSELVDDLASELDDVFVLSGIIELAQHSEELVTEVIALARRREQDILGH